MQIQTYISLFFEQTNRADAISEFGLEKFSVNVLNFKRTFAEKVSAISRACHESDESFSELKKKIRHIYDLTMLMRNPEIAEFVLNG